MDPATIALVIAAALAAFGIKRDATRAPAPAPEPEPEPEPIFPGSFPPFALYSGRGLRPAVTEGGTMRARVAEEDRGDARDAGEEPPSVAPIGPAAESRGRAAMASGQAADVVGGASARQPRPLLTPFEAVFGPGGGPGTKVQGGTLYYGTTGVWLRNPTGQIVQKIAGAGK
jgi:hypothetical protein